MAAPALTKEQLEEMMKRLRATDEQLAVFFTGVDVVLQQWTALNLVTEHNDATAATELRNNIRNWFSREGEVYPDELEDYFERFFLEARFASIEDGSPKEVGDALHQMYVQCCNNDDTLVKHFHMTLQNYLRSGVAQACTFDKGADGDDGAGDSDDDAGVAGGDDDDDAAYAEPEEEAKPKQHQSRGKNAYTTGADGWKTVVKKKK